MLKKDKLSIDMPEVRDIPGQEHIRPPRIGEMADETASSADEEGDQTLRPMEGGESDELTLDGPNNVSSEERALLGAADGEAGDDTVLRSGLLDSTDGAGTPLNEKSFGEGRNDDLSADDLDIPGADADDADEALGEEDEENNDYSISDNNDDTEVNPDL